MANHSSEAAHGGHHIVPQAMLWRTYAILMVLMILTVFAAVAPYEIPALAWMQPLSALTNSIALGIAVYKAYWVVSIFMGVRFSSNIIKLFAIGGFVWFLLLFIMLADYLTRPWEPVKGWEAAPPSALPRNVRMPEAPPEAFNRSGDHSSSTHGGGSH